VQVWNISFKTIKHDFLCEFYMFSPSSDINPCHSIFLVGIICRPIWGSLPARHHLWSNLGITCGPVQAPAMHTMSRILAPLNIAGFHVTSSFSQLKISHSPEVLVSSDIRVSKNDVLQRLSSKGFFVLL